MGGKGIIYKTGDISKTQTMENQTIYEILKSWTLLQVVKGDEQGKKIVF